MSLARSYYIVLLKIKDFTIKVLVRNPWAYLSRLHFFGDARSYNGFPPSPRFAWLKTDARKSAVFYWIIYIHLLEYSSYVARRLPKTLADTFLTWCLRFCPWSKTIKHFFTFRSIECGCVLELSISGGLERSSEKYAVNVDSKILLIIIVTNHVLFHHMRYSNSCSKDFVLFFTSGCIEWGTSSL